MTFPYFAGSLLAPTTAIRVSGPRRRSCSKTSGGCGSGRAIGDLLAGRPARPARILRCLRTGGASRPGRPDPWPGAPSRARASLSPAAPPSARDGTVSFVSRTFSMKPRPEGPRGRPGPRLHAPAQDPLRREDGRLGRQRVPLERLDGPLHGAPLAVLDPAPEERPLAGPLLGGRPGDALLHPRREERLERARTRPSGGATSPTGAPRRATGPSPCRSRCSGSRWSGRRSRGLPRGSSRRSGAGRGTGSSSSSTRRARRRACRRRARRPPSGAPRASSAPSRPRSRSRGRRAGGGRRREAPRPATPRGSRRGRRRTRPRGGGRRPPSPPRRAARRPPRRRRSPP